MAVFRKSHFDINSRVSDNFEDYAPDRYENLKLKVEEGIPEMSFGETGQISLRKLNGKYFLFCKVDVDHWKKVTELTNFDVDGSTERLNTNNMVASQSEVFNDVSVNNITGETIWQSFPFYLSGATNSRYYYIDVDDTANSFRRWDDYDTTPAAFDYRDVAGQYVVPQDCTLIAMHGVIANNSNTTNPTVYIYHGSVTEVTVSTTLTDAGNTEVSISVSRVPYKFSKEDFNANLLAGDIVVPMIKHSDVTGTRNFQGNLTLKFKTR